MTNQIFPSLQHIAARQFQKNCTRSYTSFCHDYKFPEPTPNWFKCLVQEIKFISKKDMIENMRGDIILAQNIQNHLGVPSILTGGYCAAKLGKKISYLDVVIQTFVKNTAEITALLIHLKKVTAYNLIHFKYFRILPDFEPPATATILCKDGHFACLIYFLKSPKVDSLRENRLDFADEITQRATFESLKCAGFPTMDGGYIFVALGKEEIYTFTDLQLMNESFETLNLCDDNLDLAYNNRSEAVDIFLTSGTSKLRTFFRKSASHITGLSGGLFPVRNEKILNAFIV